MNKHTVRMEDYMLYNYYDQLMAGGIAPDHEGRKGLFLHTVLEPLKTVFRVMQGDKIVGDYVTLQEAIDVYNELENYNKKRMDTNSHNYF